MRGLPRRQVLAAIVLAPAALAAGGCALLGDGAPDPLLALADQARTDAALATAVVAADALLAPRAEPVRAARAAHAAALDAEIARRAGDAPGPGSGAAAAAGDPTLEGLREAMIAAAQAATALALDLPADRVGLVASVAACCGAYAEVLA
ncbi:MAG: hypothetical protein ACT4RN_12995 [Pseudonocardia sp.]